jgi:beta-glucosidase
VQRPAKELKGIARVQLKPGETKRVTITVGQRAFLYYDVSTSAWKAEPGNSEILVGSSSARIELLGRFTLK